MSEEQTKVCPKCKQSKSISEFHRNRSRKDGHHGYCKICHLKGIKEYRQALALLKQQPPAGGFTEEVRRKAEGYRFIYPKPVFCNIALQACDRFDRAESTNKDLLAALENYVDDEPCSYDHHGYCQTHYGDPCRNQQAKAAIAKAKKEGE